MTTFKGFPSGKAQTVAIHSQFISEIVPQIDNLAELKLCLFCYYALLQKEGHYRYLCRSDFLSSAELMQGLGDEASLDTALALAVEHGFLLAADVLLDKGQERLYFVNTAKGRSAIEAIEAGRWKPSEAETVEILPERPSIFKLYEENIGALTPMIADELKELEQEYPHEWIEEALETAVMGNKRRLNYIKAVLKGWKNDGRLSNGAAHSVEQVYRENIDYGLGQIIRSKLADASSKFPQDWILEAITIAVENNVKRWSYVKAILEDWEKNGKENAAHRGTPEPDKPFYGLQWSDFAD